MNGPSVEKRFFWHKVNLLFYPEHMRDMRDLSFTMGTWNLELKRLKGGPLVQVILDHFKGFITGERSYKFVMFSGHDTTVATLLNTLGINSKIHV